MTPADLPNLVGATLLECSILWERDMAELRIGPLDVATQAQVKAPHLRVALYGLRMLDLPCDTAQDVRVLAVHGASDAERGTMSLSLDLSDARSLAAEFVSMGFSGTYPGQVYEDGDLYACFHEVMRTTIGALVAHDLRSIRLLSDNVSPDDVLNEVHLYPTTVGHPPHDAYEGMAVSPAAEPDQWYLILDLWSPEGPTDLSITMEVHRIKNELVGYLEDIHVL
jgi:hypothetical protein